MKNKNNICPRCKHTHSTLINMVVTKKGLCDERKCKKCGSVFRVYKTLTKNLHMTSA